MKKNIENYQGLLTNDFYSELDKKEYIIDKNNKTGLIFPMKNSMELKNKIEILVKNKKLLIKSR